MRSLFRFPLMGGDDGDGSQNGGSGGNVGPGESADQPSAIGSAIGGAIGGIAGGAFGGPVGAALGAQGGSALGGSIGSGGTSGETSSAGAGSLGEGIGTGLGAIFGSIEQRDAAVDAAQFRETAANQGISEQESARLAFEQRTQPFVDVGLQAGEQLQNLLSDPSAGLSEINPVVDFLRGQGFEQIQESAAARGRLGAGGTLQDLTQFNTDLASTVAPQLQNQRFNQLFNTFSSGQNAALGQGQAGLNAASNIGNLLGNAGQAQAGGRIGQSNALTGAIGNLAGAAGAFPAIGSAIGSGLSSAGSAISGAFPNIFGGSSPSGGGTSDLDSLLGL